MVAPKKTRTQSGKPPFGLLIASFTLTFLAIVVAANYLRSTEPANRIEDISKNSKRLLKPVIPKVKKYNA